MSFFKFRFANACCSALWLLLVLFSATENHAQSFAQRFFLGMETSLNTPTPNYFGAASISLAAEPKVWIANRFYLGLKGDVAIGAFGDNGAPYFGSHHTEPIMGAITSLTLNSYLEANLSSTRVFGGLGIGRIRCNTIYERQDFNSPVHFIPQEVPSQWLGAFTLGAKGENMFLSISFKNTLRSNGRFLKQGFNIQNYMSSTIGFDFGNGKHLTRFKRNPESAGLAPLMIEVGHQYAVPIGSSLGAVCRTTYFELKTAFKERYSIGLRLGGVFEKSYGTDADGYQPTYNGQVPPPFIQYGRINTMSLVRSNTLFFDYYIPRQKGWFYAGIGGGHYRFKGLEEVVFNNGANIVDYIAGIPDAAQMGGLLRLGYKVGAFRAGLDYNLTGEGVPDYASFHLGFEPGLYFYREN